MSALSNTVTISAVPPKYTPWGPSQTAREIETLPGCFRIHTAGHGGYWLSPALVRQFLDLIPTWAPWGSVGMEWFEEDCDAAAVVVAFHHAFDDELVHGCVESVICSASHGQMISVRDFLTNHPLGQMAAARAKVFHDTLAGMWRAGSRGTSGHNWTVTFNRVDTNERRTVTMHYPMKTYYTDEELDGLALG